MPTTEAFQLVGEEGLEGGGFHGPFAATVMFTWNFVVSTATVPIGRTPRRTDVSKKSFATETLINIFPKSAITPTASDSVSIAALLVKEVELKLEGVGVVGKSTENTGAG
ncbi:homeobox protein NANOG2, putative [Babesia caballi]|uniref:Homeobox protein NANOG2, putative n=1 Tax=Babesia caballi TaxID=5871 RepID=A0AAV4LX95_BABCB|nr:homeobox protein NANOG2, putative [Babesia caballi]